ncbi:MAG: transporter substrate-binding domain-containing protein [Methyloversatilis discipulorum]|uniref:substrate-binding periplasmic protein n=1 Tax=Methyloversatilis discipulorum TaxID=1119528 RepID=UPI0026EABA50|nr:transporter substrate-binding domain-containing protein [Methyloversatilis discipulorum]MBV5285216.1 transporter substrate-binding domain-containing protein [Methyloversatilis discipulorum]
MPALPFATALIVAVCAFASTHAEARDLAEVRSSGTLRIGVYKDFSPYADVGRGIDVDLGRALAERLGVKADVRSYDADENMNDDLRNIVWKGTVLGPGVSDVMMHVPVDATMSARNPQVKIFGAYHRETLAAIRSTELLPKLDKVADIDGQALGAENESIMSMALLSSDGGRLRSQVQHFHSMDDARRALEEGRIAGFLGMRSQVEPMMAATGRRFTMSMPPALPGLPQAGWALGLAVGAGDEALAQALQSALAELERDGTLDRIFKQHAVTRMPPL